MTPAQTNLLYKVKSNLDDIRTEMDTMMYRSEPMDDETYNRYRAVYDAICKVQDLL